MTLGAKVNVNTMNISHLNLNPHYHILVTGCAGFIGTNLCEALLKNGNQVTGLDNFSTGKKDNLKILEPHAKFSFIEGDIRDLETCIHSCEGIDFVLHQAALGSVPRSIKDPLTSNEVNVNGFLNMLTAARDKRVKRFVYAASSSTYGDSRELPKVEDNIGKPLSPYAITKFVNELYAEVFSKTYGIETIGLRYFNVFGRNQDPHGAYAAVIPKFVMQLMAHESPTINGDGVYSRDFTYVDNVIEANVRALVVDNTAAVNTVYNVAYGERTTLNELFEILRELLGEFDPEILKITPTYGPERPGDIPHSLASIEKAKRLLGYDPKYGIFEGLRQAVKWYWDNLKPAGIHEKPDNR